MVAAAVAPVPVKHLAHVAQHVVDMELAGLSGQQAAPIMLSPAAVHKELNVCISGFEPTVSLLSHQGTSCMSGWARAADHLDIRFASLI